MQKSVRQIVMSAGLICALFVCSAFFNGTKETPKRTYRSDITTPYGVQHLLDQRAAEGWRFVAMSEGSQDGNTVLVLVFEKE